MARFRRYLMACAILSSGFVGSALAQERPQPANPREAIRAVEPIADEATHETVKEIKLQSKDGSLRLQTITVAADGRLFGLVAPPKTFNAPTKDVVSEIHVLNAEGEEQAVWTVPFHATSINVGPDGTTFVGGAGRVARFDKKGEPIGEPVELPMIKEALKDTGELKAAAEAQVKRQRDAFANSQKQILEQIKKLESKDEDELTRTEEAQLATFRRVIESQAASKQYYDNLSADTILKTMLGRLQIINGVCSNGKDVFVACGETEGYGYAIWRLDADLKNPKKVLTNVGGCCGQLDIQVHDDGIVVAENTKHRFAKYTRDGEEIFNAGVRGPGIAPGSFGGCCNPMNVRACAGDILTAESEGKVQKFSSSGEFLHVVGNVKITGGCKNVAIGASPDGKTVYFCDQPGSQIFVLKEKASQ